MSNNKNKNKNIKKSVIREQKALKEQQMLIRKERIINMVILLVYAIILIFVGSSHELWRDEAQSWLIAKNLGFIEIISQLKYEAHPFLWYYLLRVFSIFKLKYNYITVVPILLNLITTYILLNKSQFNKFIKIIIIFSSGLFFFCGIIARSYSLAYLFMIVLSIIYKKRYEIPIYYGLLLFLIMNTHILLIGFIGGLILVDIYEFIKNKDNRKSIIKSMSFVFLGILALILQFSSTISSTGKTIHFEYLKNILSQTYQLFMPALGFGLFLAITLIMLIIYIIYLICKKEFKNLVILTCGLLFQVLFATMVYNSINASSLIYINILFVLMQSNKLDGAITTITVIIFGSTLYCTCLIVDNDVNYLFSDSKNVAKYIENNVEIGSKIYCELLDYCASVNAYLPDNKYHFIDYNTDKEYTYIEYGDYYKILYDQTLYNSTSFLDDKEMDYFIGSVSNKEILDKRNKSGNYELVYETTEDVFFSGEKYVIYKHK